MLNLINAWLKMGIGDAAFYALFGFVFVFFGILILILIFTLLGLVMKKINVRPKKSKKQKKNNGKKTEQSESVLIVENSAEEGITPEIVAVITAAVAAALESENVSCDFIVRRITKL